MKFNSQICTSRSQSERLLALGLKTGTADMTNNITHKIVYAFPFIASIRVLSTNKGFRYTDITPAWSLHRLIEMMPNEIFYEDSTLILGVFGDGVYYADNEYGEVFKSFDGNLYDCVVKCIEWLIKEGYFNKEYLEE